MTTNTPDMRFQLKRFKALCRKANLLRTQKGQTEKLAQLSRQIKAQYVYLRACLSGRSLRRALAAAGLSLGLVTGAQGQIVPNFAPPVNNPYNLATVTHDFNPGLLDLDGDNDLDLLLGCEDGILRYRENMGTAMLPTFAIPVDTPFGLDTIPFRSNYPFFAHTDLDGDGDIDLLQGDSEYGNYWYYENTGSATAPAFATPVQNPFGLMGLTEYTLPMFADVDNDGDEDLMVVDDSGSLYYYQNTGTATAPTFVTPVQNAFGWTATNTFFTAEIGDIDQDGDFDVIGNSNGQWQLFENTGSATAPAFAAAMNSPFGLQMGPSEGYDFALGDLDADGDLDIMGIRYENGFFYFENQAPVSIAQELRQEARFSLFPNPGLDEVTVQLYETSQGKNYTVQVLDLHGREVLTTRSLRSGEVLSLDLAALPVGIYEVVLSGEGVRSHRRLIKQ